MDHRKVGGFCIVSYARRQVSRPGVPEEEDQGSQKRPVSRNGHEIRAPPIRDSSSVRLT